MPQPEIQSSFYIDNRALQDVLQRGKMKEIRGVGGSLIKKNVKYVLGSTLVDAFHNEGSGNTREAIFGTLNSYAGTVVFFGARLGLSENNVLLRLISTKLFLTVAEKKQDEWGIDARVYQRLFTEAEHNVSRYIKKEGVDTRLQMQVELLMHYFTLSRSVRRRYINQLKRGDFSSFWSELEVQHRQFQENASSIVDLPKIVRVGQFEQGNRKALQEWLGYRGESISENNDA